MNKNIAERIFGWLSIFVGFTVVIKVAPYVDQFFLQKGFTYSSRQLLTMGSSCIIGIITGVIFYLLYLLVMKILKRIKRKDK